MPAALVQQATNSVLATNSITVTLGGNVTVGSMVLLSVMQNTGASSPATFTPSGGGVSWTQIGKTNFSTGSGANTLGLYVGFASTGGVNTASVASSLTSVMIANLSEWTGPNAIDGTSVTNGAGSTSTLSTGTYTTGSSPGDLLVACGTVAAANYVSGPTGGFTGLTSATAFTGGQEFELYTGYLIGANAATGYSATWTINVNATWETVLGGLIVPPPPPTPGPPSSSTIPVITIQQW